MKFRKLSLLLIFTLCLSQVYTTAFASSVVSLNAISTVKQGDSVTISGASLLDEVIMKVVRPSNSIVYFDIVKVTDGQFSSSFTVPATEAAGTYKVVVGEGSQVDTKDLVVTANQTLPPPPPPVDGEIIEPGGGGGGTGGGGGAAPKPTAPPVLPTPQTDGQAVQVDTSKNSVTTDTGANGQVTNTVNQNDEALAAALTQAAGQVGNGQPPVVTIAFNNQPGEAVNFNVSTSVLAAAAQNSVILFQTSEGQYALPISVINFSTIAQRLGTSNENIRIQVTVSPVDAETNARVSRNAQGKNTPQIGVAYKFSVQAIGNVTTAEINNFGDTYVSRSVIVDIPTGARNTTVAHYDPVTAAFTFVPAVFEKQANGKTKAIFKRNGNSIYTVLSSTKTFNDVANHWAKADIELLASKLIVNGVEESTFEPNRNITRAEFAALLVRSLGLTPENVTTGFNDVKSSDWFAGAVGAAVQAKLVDGFEDNSFKPNATITREQMAVMVSRAISIASENADSAATSGDVMAKFNDNATISGWAKASVSQAVDAKIMSGMNGDTFAPSANANRAQAVVTLKRLLQSVEFIN